MPQSAERPPVLVVDDDEGMRSSLEDILHLEGYPAVSAGTGATALDLFDGFSFPLCIVDLRLPDTDGMRLGTRFTEGRAHTQVIILTGNASVDSAIRAVRDHGFDYLVKPVHPPELLRTVAAAEDRWRLRAAEDDLRRSRSLVEALFAASPLPMVVVDADRRVRLWNRAAERVFGWPAGDVMGRVPPMATGPDGRAIQGILASVVPGEPCIGVDVRSRRRDGTVIQLRLSAAAVPDATGGASAILTVYEDMTERHRMEAHLQQVQRLDAVGRLAGGIAHDFNNLLAIMGTELDLLLTDDRLPADLVPTVTAVRKTADRGAALTRQLLAFARQQPMQPKIVAANDVVADLEHMLNRLLVDGVRLELDLGEDAGCVNVDRGKLEQVLTNIVVNARDAVGGSGRISITTSTRSGPPEEGGHSPDGGWVVISVRDTGSGIAEGLRPRLFEPFFTTKPPGSGTGLGLATSYNIVQGMGGLITVESELGRGSTFHVNLPRATGPATAEEDVRPGGAPTGNEVILMVEDDPALRDVARRLLIRQGYTVHSAADGVEARAALIGMVTAPDLLFVDAHLAAEDGRELIVEFRGRHPDLKALLTSGSFELAERADLDMAFIEKPYTLDSLARAVRRTLDGGDREQWTA